MNYIYLINLALDATRLLQGFRWYYREFLEAADRPEFLLMFDKIYYLIPK